MKPLLTLILALIIVSGCTKNGIAPQNNGNKSSGDNSKTSSDGSSQTPPDTTPKLSHDDSIHIATFNVKPQAVKASLAGTKVILVYDENVNLLFSLEGYQRTSAIHLHEDFRKSPLAGFDYTTVAEGGNTTLNWVDDNLNNVILKTVTDTIINNRKMVKVNVHRAFTFVKDYSSAHAANEEREEFGQRTADSVTFSSYCYYNQKNYRPALTSASMVYSR